MLYQPTFPSPYLETIDVENPAGNVFKCLINPKNKVIGYRINILSNIDNTLCCSIKGCLEDIEGVKTQKKSYSVDKETTWVDFDSVPDTDTKLPIVGSFSDESWLQVLLPSDVELNIFNDSDYKWNITLYQENYDIKLLTGKIIDDVYMSVKIDGIFYPGMKVQPITVIKEKNIVVKVGNEIKPIVDIGSTNDDYSRIVLNEKFNQQLTTDTSYEIYTTALTSYDYYFKARETPILTFKVPDTISSLSYTFTAELNKPNIAYYKFDLYLGSELIATSKDIYSNHISYTYDGFITGNKYSVVLTVETEDKEIITEEREFLVSYNISYSTIFVEAEMDKKTNSISLDYSSQVNIYGSTEDNSDVSYMKYKNPNEETPENKNSVRLEKGQVLYWDSINNLKDLLIPDDGTTLIHWHGDLGYTGKIAELSSNTLITKKVSIGYDSKNFYYKIGTNDIVYYNPYINGTARVIAGADNYSVGGQILSYTNENGVVQIAIPLSDKVKTGMYVSISGERKLITGVKSESETETIITIESDFDLDVISGRNFFIYDELRCYIFSDDDIPQDTDIFVENDIGYNYWWLIVIMRNEVRFIKTKRYIDTVVSK